jgi:hypothetical protein
MGTQQILVIVLSIIIVGVGVGVGIKSFQTQAYNTNRMDVAAEMQQFIKLGVQYWKTPSNQGGAGSDSTDVEISNLAAAMGFQPYRGGKFNGFYGATSDNGDFIVVGMNRDEIILKGLGKEKRGGKRPLVQMELNLNTYKYKTTYGDLEEF